MERNLINTYTIVQSKPSPHMSLIQEVLQEQTRATVVKILVNIPAFIPLTLTIQCTKKINPFPLKSKVTRAPHNGCHARLQKLVRKQPR